MVALTLAAEAERGEVQFVRVDDEEIVSIYVLCEPGRGAIRYVGSTRSPLARFAGHLAAARSGDVLQPVGEWIKQLLDAQAMPEMYAVEQVERAAREEAEERWTCWFEQRGHRLLNRQRPNFGKRAQRAAARGRQEQREAERAANLNSLYRPTQHVSIPQVAAEKQVDAATVRRACGKPPPAGIRAERIGRQWIILWSDAENWQPGKAGRPKKSKELKGDTP